MWVLADFARYPREEANLGKDVIAPYAHMVPHFDDDLDEERAWSARTTLLFFQGSLFRKRVSSFIEIASLDAFFCPRSNKKAINSTRITWGARKTLLSVQGGCEPVCRSF